MRSLISALFLIAAAAASFADTPVIVAPPAGCTPQQKGCVVSKKDLKQAAEAFRRGEKFKAQNRTREAFEAFRQAADLVPRNISYASEREVTRQELAYEHIEAGNRQLADGHRKEAVAEFRAALELDASNDFAMQRLRDAVGDAAPQIPPALQLIAQSDQVQLKPRPGVADLHYRGDVRGLYRQIATAFGVMVSFDESVVPRNVRFDVQNVDFFHAAELAGKVSRTFWAPLSESEFIVAADSPDNHRQYDRMSMRTFYVPDATAPAELNDIVNTLRAVFEIRMVSVQAAQSTIVVRAPTETLQAANRFLNALQGGAPQVMLDMQAFEVDRTVLQALGIQWPLQITMFNLPSSALALLAQPGIQSLINQLIASGGINQANAQAIQALLAQLQSQSQNPLLQQPFATFGGGITRFGVGIPPATANFNFSRSSVATLQHATLRAMQGKPSTFLVGMRYPILNATFSPILNSTALSQVIQNGSFLAAFPSFNYEDLGLIVKATPALHAGNDVTLQLETAIKTLGAQSFNGVPVISNREYKGTITVKDGEPAVVAGMISNTEQRSLSGLPGFSHIPGLGLLTSTANNQDVQAEILVVITPHVLSAARAGSSELYLDSSK